MIGICGPNIFNLLILEEICTNVYGSNPTVGLLLVYQSL